MEMRSKYSLAVFMLYVFDNLREMHRQMSNVCMYVHIGMYAYIFDMHTYFSSHVLHRRQKSNFCT